MAAKLQKPSIFKSEMRFNFPHDRLNLIPAHA